MIRKIVVIPPEPMFHQGTTHAIRHGPLGSPECGSTATVLLSEFGSTACKALYRCADCLEPFDHVKEI